ncbi:MAG: hypothetical protein ACRDFS_09290 [Chloroflexota bacterium]
MTLPVLLQALTAASAWAIAAAYLYHLPVPLDLPPRAGFEFSYILAVGLAAWLSIVIRPRGAQVALLSFVTAGLASDGLVDIFSIGALLWLTAIPGFLALLTVSSGWEARWAWAAFVGPALCAPVLLAGGLVAYPLSPFPAIPSLFR